MKEGGGRRGDRDGVGFGGGNRGGWVARGRECGLAANTFIDEGIVMNNEVRVGFGGKGREVLSEPLRGEGGVIGVTEGNLWVISSPGCIGGGEDVVWEVLMSGVEIGLICVGVVFGLSKAGKAIVGPVGGWSWSNGGMGREIKVSGEVTKGSERVVGKREEDRLLWIEL